MKPSTPDSYLSLVRGIVIQVRSLNQPLRSIMVYKEHHACTSISLLPFRYEPTHSR
ncbi:hypothetical protein Fmac_010504 [Flemingia macrophylla]|uniref:Uncharacterized protein n=1 Tax=Flemingia macrophylla TaxID=520843 RepID=A0ABD1MJR9_9FABA